MPPINKPVCFARLNCQNYETTARGQEFYEFINKQELQKRYEQIKSKGLRLDMSRGKPGADVLDLTDGILQYPGKDYVINTSAGSHANTGTVDTRNYIPIDGLDEIKEILSHIHGVPSKNTVIGGNSRLPMM
ncbi:MAG: hypothetical protein FWF82_07195 [Oscillospiraceae bacterium]|nr:hypothetical protein [Oscillospiraceae bacterium]